MPDTKYKVKLHTAVVAVNLFMVAYFALSLGPYHVATMT